MSLILAIEPDRRQASKIAALAKSPLHAELIVADSTAKAFAALPDRLPDLILTSLLLSPKDEAALADRLRELDAAGTHVQTLVIPVLGTPGRRSRKDGGGLLKRLRGGGKGKDAVPDGCDPVVFANQIAEYLERAKAEHRAAAAMLEDEMVGEHDPVYATRQLSSVASAPVQEENWEEIAFEAGAEVLQAEAAAREAAAREAAAREAAEAAAREAAAKEAAAREAARRDAEAREAAARETAKREAEAREAAARKAAEAAAREAAAKETAAREAAKREAEVREAARREAEAREAAAREAAKREAAAKEAARREAEAREAAAREAAKREAEAREAAAREAAAKEAAARKAAEAAAREAAAKEAAAREAARREAEARETAAREAAKREAEAREAAAREAAKREAAAKEAARREAAAREAAAKEAAAKEAAARKAAEREAAAREAAAQKAAARDAAIREAAAKKAALREAIAREIAARAATAPAAAELDPVLAEFLHDGGAAAAGAGTTKVQPASGAPTQPEWMHLLTAIKRDIEQLRSDRVNGHSSADQQAAPDDKGESVGANRPNGTKARSTTARKQKKAAVPVQDEWGFFDPQQCGFAALLAKLDEITDQEVEAPAKKPPARNR